MSDIQSGNTPQPEMPTPVQQQPVGWPPPASMQPGAPENTSGQKGPVPPEVAQYKWNWGAFGVNWIWAFNHGLPGWGAAILILVILSVIPLVGIIPFVLSIVLAVNGHKWAWQNRHYPGGYAQYMQVESIWSTWGIVLFVLGLLWIPIIAAILFPVFAKAREKAREESMGHACIQKQMQLHLASRSLYDGIHLLPSGVAICA